MCGRFTLQITKEMLEEIFGNLVIQDFKPRYNIGHTAGSSYSR
jgi:putative SOS response-associated peptidase YedK